MSASSNEAYATPCPTTIRNSVGVNPLYSASAPSSRTIAAQVCSVCCAARGYHKLGR